MLRLLDRKRRHQQSCQHEETASTSNYGMLRTVCFDCGHVDLEDLPDWEPESVPDLEVAADERPSGSSSRDLSAF